jgi:hypothetical protein
VLVETIGHVQCLFPQAAPHEVLKSLTCSFLHKFARTGSKLVEKKTPKQRMQLNAVGRCFREKPMR